MNANAYYFKVKDNFFTRVKIESARQKTSMKSYIIEAVQERLEQDEDGDGSSRSKTTVIDYSEPLSVPLTNK